MKYKDVPQEKKVAAILARVSRDSQETESQIADLLQDAERDGYVVPDDMIFQEKISGMDSFDKEERESLQNLKLALLKHPDIKVVYMWELTRLSRNPYYLIDQLRWFNDNQIAIYFHTAYRWTRNLQTNLEDTATTQFIFGAATYGQLEWEKIKERTKRGRDNKAKKGLFVGHIADGYKVVLKNGEKRFDIDDERAEVIRRIFDLYINKGLSTNQVAGILNNEGVPTHNALEAYRHEKDDKFSQVYKKRGTNIQIKKTQGKWQSSTVSQVLKNRWYIGERTYCGVTYSVPIIIDREIFEKAEELLKKNRTLCTKKTSAYYPLKSLLVCGKCGNFLYGHRVGVNSSYYCSSTHTGNRCGWDGIAKQNVEGIVWDLIAGSAIIAYARNENIDDIKAALGYKQLDVKKLNDEINNITSKINIQTKTIETLGKAIAETSFEIKQVEESLKKYYLGVLEKARKQYSSANEEMASLQKQLKTQQTLLNNLNNIDDAIVDQFKTIIQTKDIVSAGRIIKAYVNKVTLYNVARYTKLIEIKLMSGKYFYALYDARKFRSKYCVIPFDRLQYDIDNKFFNIAHCLYPKEAWNLYEEKYLNGKSQIEILKDSGISLLDYEAFYNGELFSPIIDRRMQKICKTYGLPILNKKFDTDELLDWIKLQDYPLNEILKLEDEPGIEVYKTWREQTKVWYKRRNARKKELTKRKRETLEKQYAGYYTRMQIAQELGLSKLKVWRDITTKKLPAEKVNGIWLVAPKDYEEYRIQMSKH